MEILDLYDRYRHRSGKTMVRGDAVPDGFFRMVIHICIFGSDGRILIQKRCKDKKTWPDLWDFSVGGAVASGEESQEAASRELLEEIGIVHDFSKERPAMTVCFDVGYNDFYILDESSGDALLLADGTRWDEDLSKLKLQREEVSDIMWASEAEVLEMISSRKFVNYHKPLAELIFSMHKQRGAHDAKHGVR
ncbi:MAG: NUDIX domain-containing protein [Clostridia bacterium]|nr:NUDIX domain-containing protein [Clostridia bacterium]